MKKERFDLTMWCLSRQPSAVQRWFQAAFNHDLEELISLEASLAPTSFSFGPSVNSIHLFSCGSPRAGSYRSRQVLHYLLGHGGTLDTQDIYGWLPINYACYFGLPQTLDLLLEAGSPVQNNQNPQPLDSALVALSQNSDHAQSAETCARYLLMHGADPKQGLTADPHWGGVTWLTWALSHDRFDWAELLFHKGSISLTQKEKHLLLIRGSPEAIAWAEYKNMGVLGMMTSKHEAYGITQRAKSLRESEQLRSFLQKSIKGKKDFSDAFSGEIDEEGEKSGGRRRI